MAPPYASAQTLSQVDGVPYATNYPMPGLEQSLYNQQGQTSGDPIVIRYGEAISAEVQFVMNQVTSNNGTYVVMQTDWGDGNWVDVAWCSFTGVSASPLLFALASSGPGAANAIQQTRGVGTAPTALGSNAITLGGRVRFVGKSLAAASSSSSSGFQGNPSGMLVTIRYKLQGVT